MTTAKVRLESADRVATIRIDRPEVRNAFDLQTWRELSEAFTAVRHDTSLRAVVLTGGDSFFSAGGDMSTMQGPLRGLTAPVERLSLAHDVIRGIATLAVPVIAAVEKYAIGVAWGLVLSCDLVVAGESAFFQAPFAMRGLVADAGTAWSLPRRLGHQRAMRYLLLSERMPTVEAYELGLVSHLAEDGRATSTAVEVARRLAGGPSESNALTKSLVSRSGSLDLQGFLEAERVAVALGAHGKNAIEGRAAFTERRTPEFS